MMEQKNKMSLQQQLRAMGRVLGYMLKDYKFSFFMVVVCILGSTLATLRGTLFMQSLIDDYIVPLTRAQTPDYSALAGALLSVAVTYGIGILCAYAYNRIMVNVSQGTMRNLREELFQHMESLPIRYFDTHAHGDIMSVYTNDMDTLRQLMSQSIPQVINSSVTIVTSFVSMLILDIPLTIITLAIIGVMVFTTSKIAAKSSVYFARQQKDLGRVNGYIEEMMDGQKVVKVFCHENKSLEQFKKLNDELRESTDKANTFSNISMPVNVNLGNVSYVLCAVVGAIFALRGYLGLTLGTLVSFLTLNKNSTQPVSQISQQLNSIVMAMAGAQRIFDLMDQEPEKDNGYVELVNVKENPDGSLTEVKERTGVWAWRHPHQADGTVTYKKLEGDITFHGVDFGYEENKIVLHDIKLYATPGQKIAFVGSTGAGKTTITNLINRFYDIADGKIRYDGININKIRKGDLRRSLGMVLQDTHLFTGTVMDNIRYGRLDATDEECIAAAKLANADGFIRRLPDGYQTMLTGDGANLSQGQRQLLAIARTAVADPPVLILDEATSSIDTRTETLVQQGMDGLM
ncbi:MAG TPA: ABC transporter ATP-binding protein/permease, partial [Candidatus Anaerofilum excrementigallinarum]|nr:ABC transporter ATP-binding protein/permease [Candidatus Anaerofilum excrementigallinarum]